MPGTGAIWGISVKKSILMRHFFGSMAQPSNSRPIKSNPSGICGLIRGRRCAGQDKYYPAEAGLRASSKPRPSATMPAPDA